MSQFVDLVNIQVQSGDGGNGMVAWRREKYEPLGGPAGGNGGRGGSVIVEATSDMSTLLDFRYKKEFKANDGDKGGPKNRQGKQASDLVIKVPVGTIIRDCESQQVIADLCLDQQRVLVADGGRGGRGNHDLSSHGNRAPHYCEPGELGIARGLQLELKLLADVGIVGLPNAGKSTLLSVMTAARPKIADYPFSTLQPNLGVVQNPQGDGFVMADVPGLIAGASQGVGLGHKFLRHLERTRILVHMADVSAENVCENIATIGAELNAYSKRLSALPQILVLNKSDVVGEEEAAVLVDKIAAELDKLLPETQEVIAIMQISCGTKAGIVELRNLLVETLSKMPIEDRVDVVYEDPKATQRLDDGFAVQQRKGAFFVTGIRLERMVAVTNMRSSEAVYHLFSVMRSMGVIDALVKSGAEPGDSVVIGEVEFSFGPEMF